MTGAAPSDAVSFDLFGTLVAVERPGEPAEAVAAALESRGVDVPEGWSDAYAATHRRAPPGAEVPLHDHVAAALGSLSVPAPAATVEAAVREAFDADVRTRPGAAEAVAAAADRGPVGLLSNCSVPGLARRALADSGVEASAFDAVVASVDCGWRKPDPRAFRAVADELGVPPGNLLHVGDDHGTDCGATAVGADYLEVGERAPASLPDALEGRPWD